MLVQFVGVPFSFLFGALAGRIGAKPAIFLALVVYTGISVLGYFMTTAWQFFVLAFLVGTVQGGSQALSRSLFARMIPQHKSSEFFGFFSVFEKFAGIFGPALFAASVTRPARAARRSCRYPLLRGRRPRADPREHRGGTARGQCVAAVLGQDAAAIGQAGLKTRLHPVPVEAGLQTRLRLPNRPAFPAAWLG